MPNGTEIALKNDMVNYQLMPNNSIFQSTCSNENSNIYEFSNNSNIFYSDFTSLQELSENDSEIFYSECTISSEYSHINILPTQNPIYPQANNNPSCNLCPGCKLCKYKHIFRTEIYSNGYEDLKCTILPNLFNSKNKISFETYHNGFELTSFAHIFEEYNFTSYSEPNNLNVNPNFINRLEKFKGFLTANLIIF